MEIIQIKVCEKWFGILNAYFKSMTVKSLQSYKVCQKKGESFLRFEVLHRKCRFGKNTHRIICSENFRNKQHLHDCRCIGVEILQSD